MEYNINMQTDLVKLTWLERADYVKEKFFELSQEKQLRIINAGFKVFAQNEYKRAATDEIARLAETSKGLLFYYFQNKKELYLYLFEQAMKIVMESVINTDYMQITDFFELCEYAARQKQELLSQTPYIMDFLVNAYYSQKEDVSEKLNNRVGEVMATLYQNYFNHIDLSKFKSTVSPDEILKMLKWMADGYLYETRRTGKEISIDDFMEQYKRWSLLLKQIAYKEDFVI